MLLLARDALLEGLRQRLHDLQVRAARVGRRHDVPGREIVVGFLQQHVGSLVELLVVAVVAAVLLGHTPFRRGVGLQLVQSALLLGFRYVQEELHNCVAVVGELLFEADDGRRQRLDLACLAGIFGAVGTAQVVERLAELLCAALFLLGAVRLGQDMHRAAVPRLVEDAHRAVRSDLFPETLHEGQATLVADGLARDVHEEKARVEVGDQVRDAAALARGVPSLEDDDDGQLGGVRLLLQGRQARDQLVFARFVVFFDDLRLEVDRVEHAHIRPPARVRLFAPGEGERARGRIRFYRGEL